MHRLWLVGNGLVGLLLVLGGAAGAPAASAGPPLMLSDAVRQALEQNPEIQRMRERLQAAQAKAKRAGYLEDPEIAFQLGGIPFSTPTNLNQADANLVGIRQKLPFFGKLGLKERIAAQEVKIAEQELHAKEREIVALVKTAYAALFMARRSVEILLEQLEIMRGVVRATEARYQVGRVTQQDVFKALLGQTEITNQLIVAEEEASAAAVKLNSAMFRPPHAPIEIAADLSLPKKAVDLAGIDEMALAHRPELKGAEAEVARSERMYELAERERKYPDFMVGWDYMRMPTEMKKDRYAAMVNITIPFSPWTAGRRNSEVEESLAEMRAAKASREAAKNMTLREVGELKAKVRAAERLVELFRDGILPQAELSFRSSLAAYQSGRGEFLSLLDAERTLRESRMGYFKNQVALMQALADLERVVGKELQ